MTRTPLPSYPGNGVLPINSRINPLVSKARTQQSRFVHTKAKTKMEATAKTVNNPSAPKVIKVKPVDVLRTIMSTATHTARDKLDSTSDGTTLSFKKPCEEDIAAYDIETVRAIRANNVDLLRKLWENGKSMDACNQFGESLIHMACRRGYVKILEFMLLEVKVKTERCDDFGRNPFHDALWTPTPNFALMDLLIDNADPSMLLLEDVRGNTPFAYARANHSEQWISYLEKRKEKLIQRIQCTAGEPVTSETATKPVSNDAPVKVVA